MTTRRRGRAAGRVFARARCRPTATSAGCPARAAAPPPKSTSAAIAATTRLRRGRRRGGGGALHRGRHSGPHRVGRHRHLSRLTERHLRQRRASARRAARWAVQRAAVGAHHRLRRLEQQRRQRRASAGVGSSEPELADAASSGVRTSSPARSHGGVWIFARGDGGGGSAAADGEGSASSAVRAVTSRLSWLRGVHGGTSRVASSCAARGMAESFMIVLRLAASLRLLKF